MEFLRKLIIYLLFIHIFFITNINFLCAIFSDVKLIVTILVCRKIKSNALYLEYMILACYFVYKKILSRVTSKVILKSNKMRI